MTRPRKLNLGRNANSEHDTEAVCDQFTAIVDGKRATIGRVVSVPAVTFDEGDARAMRRLATWLTTAAEWVSGD